ncbi:MAG: TetR/AcrR family transcriptional regulator [Dehalococcoidia bacterium]
MTDVNPPGRTSYRQLQAEETKQRIARAARRLFAEQGYARTSMAAVAVAAGVANRTVYAAFGTKQAILAAICDAWLAEADVFALGAQALAEPDAGRRLALVARLNRQQWERGTDVVALLDAAATTDRDVARMLAGWKAQRGRILAEIVTGIAGHLAGGLDEAMAAAILRGLSAAEIYRELVEGAGWSADHYEQWLAALFVRELLGATYR